MARSKKQAQSLEVNGATGTTRLTRTPSPESERPTGPLSVVVTAADRDVVKINNLNATELKNACDDAIKRVSR